MQPNLQFYGIIYMVKTIPLCRRMVWLSFQIVLDSLTLKFSTFLKLREFAFELHQKMDGGASETEIDQLIKEQMKTVYR